MCGSMADIQSAAAEIRRGKKEERIRKTNHSMKIYMVCPITYGDHKQKVTDIAKKQNVKTCSKNYVQSPVCL